MIVIFLTFMSIENLPAQIVVIVNSQNPVTSVSLNALERIYTANVVQWESSDGSVRYITLSDYKNKSDVVERFFKTVTGLSHSKIRLKWIGKMLTGEIQQVPKKCFSEKDVIEFVASNTGAIGFIDASMINKLPESVKLLKINDRNYAESDYPLM
ncbi:MAG: substrate-binding domain-containing protein [Bacteroidetes bacterium]|nr:substrate-binding domain-containing protein [Bacteroidota bacterium]